MNNKLNLKALPILISMLFVPMLTAKASPPTGGLMGMYTKLSWQSSTVYVKDKEGATVAVAPKENLFMDARVENIDFWDFDPILNDRIGRTPYTAVQWRGAIKIDEYDTYDFNLRTNWLNSKFSIGEASTSASGSISKTLSVELEPGWHKVYVWHPLTKETYDARAVFRMKKSSESDYYQIPSDHLSPAFWSDEEITIPFDGSEDKRLNYVAAGAGARDKDEAGIKIDMPSDVLASDVLVIWYNTTDPGEDHKLTIKNEETGAQATITGINLTSVAGTEVDYPEVYGRVPASLIDDNGTGKLNLSFRKPTGLDFKDGIALIVPFEDPTQDEGQLNIKMVAATGYKGMAPAMVFELDDSQENVVSPLFILSNGETKSKYPVDGTIRPNYLYMAYGTGTLPGKTSIVKYMSGAQRLLPKDTSFSMGDPDTFFPAFGRDGKQLDVVSSNYVPNQHASVSGQYTSANEGKIDQITIPTGNDWVAFQYYGTNFEGSGVVGSGESSSITGGGVLAKPATAGPNRKLEVSVSGNGTVKSTNVPGIDCPGDCEESYPDGQAVVLNETPDYQNEFTGWSGSGTSCDGTTVNPCNLTVSADTTINAAFGYVPGGVCSSANGGSSCSEPSYKCYLGTVINENYDPVTKTWTWQCEKDGYTSGICSTKQKCDIKEVTP